MNLSGTWRGKLLDVKGFSGDLELKLEHLGNRLEGQVSLAITDEESSNRFSASLVGTQEDETITLAYEEPSPVILPLRFVFRGQVADADPHAIYCIYGTYEIEGKKERSLLGGGCCLFWLYRT